MIWQAIVGNTIYDLNGNPAYVMQVHGVGLPPARRLSVRSPQQHGYTDVGFRYDAREIRVSFFFNGGNPADADGRRDEVYGIFKALSGTPVKLRATRPDGSVRQIDCFVSGVVDLPWVPDQNQMGQQSFVVTLVAADPVWYDPTQVSTVLDTSGGIDWWLALGTIDSGEVEEHVESPSAGQSIDSGVLIGDGVGWTLFLRTNLSLTAPATSEVAFNAVNSGGSNSANAKIHTSYNEASFINGAVAGAFLTGQHDYFFVNNGSGLGALYRDDNQSLTGYATSINYGIDGSQSGSRWRSGADGSNVWPVAIPYAAIYNVELTYAQRLALVTAVDGNSDFESTISYEGDFHEYPVVTITGPITNPVINNISTGEKLDFTGVTISAGDSYTIDCRFGRKTVKNGAGANKIADLTSDSDLATFHIAAGQEVANGNNAITATGTGIDGNTRVTVAYFNRYVGL